jgi:hypothetical protein
MMKKNPPPATEGGIGSESLSEYFHFYQLSGIFNSSTFFSILSSETWRIFFAIFIAVQISAGVAPASRAALTWYSSHVSHPAASEAPTPTSSSIFLSSAMIPSVMRFFKPIHLLYGIVTLSTLHTISLAKYFLWK